MRAKRLRKVLATAIAACMPVLVVGAPGIGKSDIVAQACADAGADLMISHPAIEDPTKPGGLPWIAKGDDFAQLLPFADLYRALNATAPLVWFLDDLGQATAAVQAAYMQLLLAREVNGQKLPDCVTFIAATNRRTDRAGVSGILEPVKSRFATIVELEAHIEDFLDWAAEHDVAPEVRAYLRLQPESLHDFTPTADMTNSPSPRTWKRTSDWIKLSLDAEDELPVYAGAIGMGEAAKFCGYLKMYRELPTIEGILLDPKHAAIPKDTGALWAVSMALASYATEDNFDRVCMYAERLPQEFGIACVRDATRRNADVLKTHAWIKYATGPLGKAIMGQLN